MFWQHKHNERCWWSSYDDDDDDDRRTWRIRTLLTWPRHACCCGTVWYFQSYTVPRTLSASIGMLTFWSSNGSPPASRTSTLRSSSSVRRLANTAPAVPAPTDVITTLKIITINALVFHASDANTRRWETLCFRVVRPSVCPSVSPLSVVR